MTRYNVQRIHYNKENTEMTKVKYIKIKNLYKVGITTAQYVAPRVEPTRKLYNSWFAEGLKLIPHMGGGVSGLQILEDVRDALILEVFRVQKTVRGTTRVLHISPLGLRKVTNGKQSKNSGFAKDIGTILAHSVSIKTPRSVVQIMYVVRFAVIATMYQNFYDDPKVETKYKQSEAYKSIRFAMRINHTTLRSALVSYANEGMLKSYTPSLAYKRLR
jgi:hypothetical protein